MTPITYEYNDIKEKTLQSLYTKNSPTQITINQTPEIIIISPENIRDFVLENPSLLDAKYNTDNRPALTQHDIKKIEIGLAQMKNKEYISHKEHKESLSKWISIQEKK